MSTERVFIFTGIYHFLFLVETCKLRPKDYVKVSFIKVIFNVKFHLIKLKI